MPENLPDGFTWATFRHVDGSCPFTGDTASKTAAVPIDNTDWSGVYCNACDQQLIEATPEAP